MATKSNRPTFTVYAELDSSDLKRGLSDVNQSFGMTATGINQGMELVSKAFGALKMGVAVFAALTTSAMGYGKALAEVQTISDRSVFTTERITGITRNLANLYGSDVTQNAKALYQTISAGTTDAAGATNLLDAAAKLSIGGLTDMTTAVDALTNVVNAYLGTGLEAAEVSDALFVAIRDGKTTASELASQLGQIVGVARQVGVSFDEVAASVATITTNGISTETAVIQLRQVLASLLKPSKQAVAEAQNLGVEFNVAAVRAKGLNAVLREIVTSQNFTDESSARLFGNIRALSGVMALTANNGQKVNQILADMAGKAGASDAAFKRMTETLSFQVDRWGALTDALKVALGSTASDSIAAREGLKSINDTLAGIVEIVSSPEFGEFVNVSFVKLATAIAITADHFTSFMRAMEGGWGRIIGFLDMIVQANNAMMTLGALFDMDQFEASFKQAFANGIDRGLVTGLSDDPTLAAIDGFADRLRDAVSGRVEFGIKDGLLAAGSDIARVGAPDGQVGGFLDWLSNQGRKKTPRSKGVDNGDALGGSPGGLESTIKGMSPSEINAALFGIFDPLNEGSVAGPIDGTNEALKTTIGLVGDLGDRVSETGGMFEGFSASMKTSLQTTFDFSAGLQNLTEQVINTAINGIAGSIAAMVDAAVRGKDGLKAMGEMIGGMIQQIGTMIIQFGVAAVIGGTLGTIVPFLAAPTGGAAGIAAGAAAIAVGAGMVGIGALIKGGSSTSAGSSSSAPRGGGGRSSSSSGTSSRGPTLGGLDSGGLPSGFSRGPGGEKMVNNYSFSFGAGAVVGTTEAGVGRVLDRLIRKAKRLDGAPVGG